MDKLYTPNPDGYCGDEDNGQTSAWYVFSAMGFYPVCPGSNQYVLGTPYFDKMTLHLENGKTMTITAKGNSDETRYVNSMTLNGVPYNHKYIQTMTLNGATYDKNYITYNDVMKGGSILFNMGATPNKQRGTLDEDVPYSFSNTLKAVKTKKGKKK